jgi:hypothetical protein
MQNKYEQELADVDFDAYAEAFDDISLNRI